MRRITRRRRTTGPTTTPSWWRRSSSPAATSPALRTRRPRRACVPSPLEPPGTCTCSARPSTPSRRRTRRPVAPRPGAYPLAPVAAAPGWTPRPRWSSLVVRLDLETPTAIVPALSRGLRAALRT